MAWESLGVGRFDVPFDVPSPRFWGRNLPDPPGQYIITFVLRVTFQDSPGPKLESCRSIFWTLPFHFSGHRQRDNGLFRVTLQNPLEQQFAILTFHFLPLAVPFSAIASLVMASWSGFGPPSVFHGHRIAKRRLQRRHRAADSPWSGYVDLSRAHRTVAVCMGAEL